jgi:hypothetical protein
MLEMHSAVLHALLAPLREVVLYGFSFRSFVAVNIDIFETEVFCARLLMFVLRRLYNANADFIQFLLSECLVF